MRSLLDDAARRSIAYLEHLGSRPVSPDKDAVRLLRSLDMPMPERPEDAASTLALLDALGSATMAMAGPRFFGFVIGGAMPVSLAANWLAGAWDQNTALYNITPATSHLEKVALGWLLDVLGLPGNAGAGFVTGATAANFTCLAAARHSVLKRAGWNVEAQGLFGAPEITVVIGDEAHPTLIKSLGLLGLGRNRVVRVPVDNQGRMNAAQLPKLTGPAIVCVQVGNVNTGSIDPVAEICSHVHRDGAWVHVDGAFGLWAKASPALGHLVTGVELADSWATDAHKWLNVPYDCGLAFVRDRSALQAAMAITAEYLPTESEHRNPADFTPELSRRARGVEVWAVLRTLGKSGLSAMIERTCRHARRFAEGLAHEGCRILNEVVLNQVLVSFGDPETTNRIIEEIQADGTCWCGGTVWQGQTAMRISVSSWATTDEDVERSLEAMVRIARKHMRTGAGVSTVATR